MLKIKKSDREKILKFDLMTYNSNYELLNRINQQKEQKLNDVKINNGQKNLKQKDIIDIMIDNLPIILVQFNDQHDLSLYYYDYNDKVWCSNSIIFNQIIYELNESKASTSEVARFKQSFKSNPHLPLVNIVSDSIEIIDNKFNTYIDFKNGRYNMLTGELTPIKISDLALTMLDYDLADHCDDKNYALFEKYFNMITSNNANKKLALQQIHLACIMGYNPGIKAINFYGKSGNGKSTAMKVMHKIAGGNKYAIKFSYEDLTKDDSLKEIGQSKILLGFDNKDNLNIVNVENIFKSLVSKEPFSYSVKYEDRQVNIFHGLFIQAFNAIPKFTESNSTAITDRLYIIEFDNKIRNSNYEIKDFDVLITNPNIIGQFARYLIEEVQAFNDFVQLDEIANKLINENNPVYLFFDDIKDSIICSNTAIPISHLFIIFKEWYFINYSNRSQLSANKFKKEIEPLMLKLGYNLSTQVKRPSVYKNQNLYYELLMTINYPNVESKLLTNSPSLIFIRDKFNYSNLSIDDIYKLSLNTCLEIIIDNLNCNNEPIDILNLTNLYYNIDDNNIYDILIKKLFGEIDEK